ncbi:hypothetical protein, partial [Mesorhizobium sp.]|uniref:hypothetical protein n=1 Tax=Mesorhizobium sp. TaxID=1871066 RepID=UPI0025C4F898
DLPAVPKGAAGFFASETNAMAGSSGPAAVQTCCEIGVPFRSARVVRSQVARVFFISGTELIKVY